MAGSMIALMSSVASVALLLASPSVQTQALSTADRETQQVLAGTWFAEDELTHRWDGQGYRFSKGTRPVCRGCCAETIKYNSRLEVRPASGLNGVLVKGKATVLSTVSIPARVEVENSSYDAVGRRNVARNIDNGVIDVVCPPNPDAPAATSSWDVVIASRSGTLSYTSIGGSNVTEFSLRLLSDDAMERSGDEHKRLYRKQ